MIYLPYVFCIAVTWLMTVGLVSYGHREELLAIPNGRSSHSIPTPTSGGIAILVSFLIYVLWRLLYAPNEALAVFSLTLIGSFIGGVGYIDDRAHVSAAIRLPVHFLAAGLTVFLLPVLPTIDLFGWSWQEGILLSVLLVFALVWLINLFNFMDGIDGIAGIEALAALAGAALILSFKGDMTNIPYLVALACCVLGFLVLNWPPARIFMGDVGSGFLGLMLGGFALITSATGVISIWSWVILLALFVADATVTLIRRAVRGQRVYQAHRSHAYQILSRRWQSHQKVTLLVLLVNLVWLLPLAFTSSYWPDLGATIAVISYLPLMVCVYRIGAGTTNH